LPPGTTPLDSSLTVFAEEARARADMAVVSGHALPTLGEFPGAVVGDLYDPFLVENLAYTGTLGPGVFDNDRRALFTLAERADLLLAASEEHRPFYARLLLGRGALGPEALAGDPDARRLLATAPFGVDEGEPGPPRSAPELGPSPHDVLFGGVYDWYDPELVLDAWPEVL